MFNLCLQVKINALHRKYLGCAQQEYLIGRIKMKRCTFCSVEGMEHIYILSLYAMHSL